VTHTKVCCEGETRRSFKAPVVVADQNAGTVDLSESDSVVWRSFIGGQFLNDQVFERGSDERGDERAHRKFSMLAPSGGVLQNAYNCVGPLL